MPGPGITLLDKTDRQTITRELDRLRKIAVAIDQLEACGEDCAGRTATLNDLWNFYQKRLQHLYGESPQSLVQQTTPQQMGT